MSIILHHTDMDGYCSARIARDTLLDPFDQQNATFIPYNYKGGLDKINLEGNKTLIITDLCCNTEIEALIRRAITEKINVIHIDHHASSIDYYNAHMQDLEDNELYTKWFSTRESASLLTWIFSFMNNDDKKRADSVQFDFAEDYSSFIMNNTNNMYGISDALRYINDNDIFRHQFPESKKFVKGMYSLKRDDIKPWAGIWNQLLYSSDKFFEAKILSDLIIKGEEKIVEEEKEFKRERMNAFEIEIFDTKITALNTTKRTADLFGNAYHESDIVICFNYTKDRLWAYTLYSDRKKNVLDFIKDIEKEFPGFVINPGGHPYAGGFSSKHCLFDLI